MGQASRPVIGMCRTAGPPPIFYSLHQSCRQRIFFNIFNDLFQLCRSPHPMIVGFVLPKRLTGAPGERAEKFLTALVMRDSAASSSKLRSKLS